MSSGENQTRPHDQNTEARITSLATLRALQKATKQFTDIKNNNLEQIKNDVSKQKTDIIPITSKDKPSPNSKKKVKNPDDNQNYELRKNFQTALSKLYTIETKELALNELKTIIMNNLSPKNLGIFLSSLTEYKTVDNPTPKKLKYFFWDFSLSNTNNLSIL